MLPHMNLLGFFHTEKQKKIFFEQPNNQKPKTKKLNKSHFQGFVNSQYFFMKISWIGPWVSRIVAMQVPSGPALTLQRV